MVTELQDHFPCAPCLYEQGFRDFRVTGWLNFCPYIYLQPDASML